MKKTGVKKKVSKRHIVYHKDGSIWAKGKMNGKVPEGYWEWFRKPARNAKRGEIGTIMRSGHFKKGKQVGEWITYDKKGKVYKITNFNK